MVTNVRIQSTTDTTMPSPPSNRIRVRWCSVRMMLFRCSPRRGSDVRPAARGRSSSAWRTGFRHAFGRMLVLRQRRELRQGQGTDTGALCTVQGCLSRAATHNLTSTTNAPSTSFVGEWHGEPRRVRAEAGVAVDPVIIL